MCPNTTVLELNRNEDEITNFPISQGNTSLLSSCLYTKLNKNTIYSDLVLNYERNI